LIRDAALILRRRLSRDTSNIYTRNLFFNKISSGVFFELESSARFLCDIVDVPFLTPNYYPLSPARHG
jgi:hypothetical protein